jgi:heme oxygenase (biliverdin-producing, ferredoxin)
MSLLNLFRNISGELHATAEKTVFATKLASGDLTLMEYRSYLLAFQNIYSVLESRIKESRSQAVQSLFFPELVRSGAIVMDLEELAASNYQFCSEEDLKYQGCAQFYREHLADLDEAKLVAHWYVLYLGNLSGGQMIAGMLKAKYQSFCFYFYDFGTNARELKARALGLLSGWPDSREQVVAEVRLAFKFNIQVLENLGSCYLCLDLKSA